MKEEHEVHLKLVLELLTKSGIHMDSTVNRGGEGIGKLIPTPSEANVVADALSRKERVKPRCVRAMAITIQYGVKEMILAAQNKIYYDLRDLYWWGENVREILLYTLVIVDRLTKSTHFLANHEDFNTEKLARLYIDETVARHGVPMLIISDRDGRFTSHFWQTIQKALGTRVDLSSTYHPQTDRQSERKIQTLKDMLRACVIDFGGSWDVIFPKSPMLWAEIKVGRLIGAKLVLQTTYKVVLIKEKLKAARDRQKRYADKRRKPLEFEVGDRVLLKVSPWKGIVCFRKKDELAPRYVGPFEILERIVLVAYRLRLPEELSSVHDTFHVSNRRFVWQDDSFACVIGEEKGQQDTSFSSVEL
ncbi:putative reverse transcriptase domain-containing protein [Tanacetum coccineum]